MTRRTMTSWIEIADERQFCQTVRYERMPRPEARQRKHLGWPIFGLPTRILDALSRRNARP